MIQMVDHGTYGLDDRKGEKKKKTEKRGEKRISVIHTDSVVMKGIESFIIYRAYGRRSFYFLMGRAVRRGAYMFRAYSISMGTATCFPFHWPWYGVTYSVPSIFLKHMSCPGYHIRRTTTCFPVHCPYLKADAHLVVSLFSLSKYRSSPKGERINE